MSQSSEFTSFFRTLLPAYSDEDITIDELYPDPAVDPSSPYLETRNIPVGPQYKRVEAAYGHYAYACPVRQTATLASAGQEEPVFLYRWALNKTVQGGASHGDQMAYETFNPEVRGISRSQEEIAGTFHAYITSFIVTGDPNVVGGRYENRTVWKRTMPRSHLDAKSWSLGKGMMNVLVEVGRVSRRSWWRTNGVEKSVSFGGQRPVSQI